MFLITGIINRSYVSVKDICTYLHSQDLLENCLVFLTHTNIPYANARTNPDTHKKQ